MPSSRNTTLIYLGVQARLGKLQLKNKKEYVLVQPVEGYDTCMYSLPVRLIQINTVI